MPWNQVLLQELNPFSLFIRLTTIHSSGDRIKYAEFEQYRLLLQRIPSNYLQSMSDIHLREDGRCSANCIVPAYIQDSVFSIQYARIGQGQLFPTGY